MLQFNWKGAIPHIVAVIVFLIVSLSYFSPLLKGEKIKAHDLSTYLGMSSEIRDYRATTGKEALWTNRMFGGMPSYLSGTSFKGNGVKYIDSLFRNIPRPASTVFIAFLGFYILMIAFGVNPWIGIIASLAYGLSSFLFIILSAGHMTKALAMAYMAPALAGFILAYRKKILWGGALFGISMSLELIAGHPQITYYLAIMLIIIGVVELVYAIKEKTLPRFFKSSAVLILFGILAIGSYTSYLAPIMEYSPYSMRGESELKTEDGNQTTGLDKDYILDYSYDIGEAFTAFIPRLRGGGMSEPLDESSAMYQALKNSQGAAFAKRFCKHVPLYWGSQPIVSGPFYFGIILCFLFILGLFVVKGRTKCWLATVVLIAFLFSLGKNFDTLSSFLLHHLPGYNKFRDVKNIVVIQNLAMAILGALAVSNIYKRNIETEKFNKYLLYSVGICAGIPLLIALIPSLAGSFIGNSDAQLASSGWPANLIQALKDDRVSVLRSDAFKTVCFVLIAGASLWATYSKKLKWKYGLAIWAVLVIADMWPTNKKYFNDNNFESPRKAQTPYPLTHADKEILKDTDPNYRVLNIAVSTFNDASTAFYHKSIGGYHGAKMQRYQDIIDHALQPEMQTLINGFQNISSPSDLNSIFTQLSVLNMLNTRYIIYNPKAAPIQNPEAYGNAWCVKEIQMVSDAHEEIEKVTQIDPKNVAIADKRFEKTIKGKSFDGKGTITLTSYDPNVMKYHFSSKTDQLAVFSEIYYPKGWNAFIDGKEVPHFRVDYILRALNIPQGDHEIEFRFEPQSYITGTLISRISSTLLILLALAIIGLEIYKKSKQSKIEANE